MASAAAAVQIPHNPKLHQLLSNTKISGHSHDSNLLVFHTSDTAAKAFSELSNRGLHSAPVFDDDTNQWAGIVDLRTFVSYALFLHEHKMLPYFKISDDVRPLKELIGKNLITGAPVENNWVSVNDTQSLYDLFQRFFLTHHHRLPVISLSDPQKLVGIISQSDLVRFVNANSAALEDLLKLRITDLNLVRKDDKVLGATLGMSLMEVYKFLSNTDKFGCAVVDQVGHLVGNISLSDLKYQLFEDLKAIEMTTEQFLKRTPNRHYPIYVHEDATLGNVIQNAVQSNVSRVYVCDQSRKLLGVVSLTDIIRIIASAAVPPK